MNRRTSFLVLALVAMFAFSTTADAQFGGLLNKARKAAGIKTKQEKTIESITPTIPQPAAEGTKAREERAAREEAMKKEFAELNVMIEDGSFRTIGRVGKNGIVEDDSFRTIGHIRTDGVIEDSSFRTIGRIKGNTVEDGSFRTVGRFDGRTYEDSSFRTVGRFSNGTVEDGSFRTIGRIKGTTNQTVLAACFYFFFFKDQVK